MVGHDDDVDVVVVAGLAAEVSSLLGVGSKRSEPDLLVWG